MSQVPRVPIVAVGAVIWNARGECVLVRRGRPPRENEWSIPGGKVEWGETVHDALLREVREETGIAITVLGLTDVVDSLIHDAEGGLAHHHVLLDFTAMAQSGELAAGDDVREARWVPFEALDDYEMWEETRRVVRASRRALAEARMRGRREPPDRNRTPGRPRRG